MMFSIPGFTIKAQIYESSNSLVYRGINQSNDAAVIFKVLKENYVNRAEFARYKQEYAILCSLKAEGIIKAYSLQEYQKTLVIILEDFEGESLQKLMKGSEIIHFPMPLAEFLRLAIKITKILGEIHSNNVIHKDINPSNIVLNPKTGVIKIIDFGISTRLTSTNPTLSHPDVLEGTLAYMSPEQTGRMSGSLDYRTDFYALGVTFYELLTGQLPFTTPDALELVHCHLAKQPVPPHLLRGDSSSSLNPPQCPKAISAIVMKLMAKTAEERYQSAWGIVADLEECVLQLETMGRIQEFSLGTSDSSNKFQIPQKLYGREVEVTTLLAAFDRVATDGISLTDNLSVKGKIFSQADQPSAAKTEMMLVVGYSGIGKSALVAEICKPIIQKKGYFISGKFDQLGRNIPYSAVASALAELVRQLLTESEANLNQWRVKLLSALGSNAQVVIDVIPEVEWIIGKQQPVPELGVPESQNRFNLVFQKFIQVFCDRKHPLVIFLDDLQWADPATLKLLQLMLTDATTHYLFLIGAYRDNEVSPTHPLIITLEGLRKEGVKINQITLAPLQLIHVNQLIADTLHSDVETVKPLAALILQKTEGNPFFVKEFLKTLYAEHLITFSSEEIRTQNPTLQSLDLKSIVKASQALFGELPIEILLAKIIKIIIENAAAQSGYLIVNKNEEWVIEASGNIESNQFQGLQSIPIEKISDNGETPLLSNAIANYVIRTQKSIVLHDAVHEGEFIRDPYILKQQPKSILCTPLIYQGKRMGILYLENNLTTGAFTPDRLEVLKLLSLQAAIAIENAKLYAQLREAEKLLADYNRTLETKVTQRTAELTQINQQLEREIADRKRAQEALQQSEARYRALVEDQTELVSRFLPDGTLTFINEAYCRYLGVKREDLIGKHYAPVVFADDLEHVEQQLKLINRDNPVVIIENRVVVGGEVRWTQWINRALFDQQGNLVELQSVGRDISDKKQVELALQESERRYRQIVETADEGIWALDLQGNTTFANPKIAQMLGYRVEEMLGLSVLAFMDEQERATAKQNLERCRQGIAGKYDWKLRRKDGSELWVMVAASPIFNQSGQYMGALGMITNITQCKYVEDALRQYERIVSTTTDAIALIDRNYRYQAVNHTYQTWQKKREEDIIGYSVPEILGVDIFEHIIKQLLDRSLAGETLHYQAWCDYRFEKRRFLSVTLVPYVEPDPTISGVVVSLRDLTELKQAEEELQRSEERFQLAFEGSGDGFWDWNITTGEIYWSPQWFTMLGYEVNELPGELSTWQQVVHPDDLPWITEKLSASLKDVSVVYNCDYRLRTKSGTWKWISTYGRVVARDTQGTPVRMAGIHRDISEKKRAEEALRESEQRYRQIVETSEEGIWVIDLEGKTLFANPKMAQMLGCNVEEMLGLSMFAFMDEEGIAISTRNLERCCQGIQDKQDFKFRRKDGSELWTIISTSPIMNESGQSTGALGMLTDITQRKQAEEALAQSERLFRLLAEISPVGIFRSDVSGRTIYANERACQIVGATLNEVLGWGWGSYIHPEDAIRVQHTWQSSITHLVPWQDEYRLLNREGKTIWVLSQVEVERDEAGKVVGYVGTLTDISDRKAAEIALREQKELLQAIFDHIPVMVCFYNAEAQIELINPAMENIIGWSLEEIRQIDIMTECYPDPDYRAALLELMMRADGTWRDVQLRTRAGTVLATSWANVRLPNGWQVGIGQDITDRKRAELALQESESRFREIAETISQFFFVRSATSGQYLYANPAYERIWGRTCESLYQNPHSWLETIHPDDRQFVLNSIQEQFQGQSVKREYRIIRPDGQERWIVADISIIRDEAGQTLRFVGLAEDITERKQAEEALRESENRFRAVFEQAAVGIGLCTLEGRFFRVNQKLCNIVGYTDAEMLERTFEQITPLKDRPQVREFVQQLLVGEIENYSLEHRYICKDGSLIWVNVAVSLMHDPTGEPKSFIYVAEDISDRKRAELALLKSEHALAEAQHLAHLGNWSFDVLTRELTWSEETFRIYGLDPTQGEPTQEQHLQQLHPDDREKVLRSIELALTQGIGYEHEIRIFLSNGSMRYTLRRGQPVFNEMGQVVQLFGTVQDITERKRAEEELRQSEEKFRQLAENIEEVFFILSQTGDIIYISPAYEHIWGTTCQSLYRNPHSWLESVHPEEQQTITAALHRQIRDMAVFDETYRIVRPDGDIRWIRARSFPIEHENTYRFVGIAEDISERKLAEDALQRAKEAAEAANQAKSAFLANMSHELRTPLNAILGFSQLMARSSSLPPEHKKNLDTIIHSGEHLLTLINQVLDLSKIEAGRATLNETNFNLYHFLDDVQQMFQLKANNKGLYLHFERGADVPQYIRTDEVKLRQVLINLLSNAMKFTTSGGVFLRVRRRTGNGEREIENTHLPFPIPHSQLHFEIEDTGSGIAPEELESIFEAFVQTKTGQQFQEGTGLGLTISRKFVQLMGGEISINSQVNQGTVVLFDIQANAVAATDIENKSPSRRVIALAPNQPSYRLLIVDDHADNRQILIELLSPFGFELKEASNGLEALEIWEDWKPHLVFMDMWMPLMNGYEATQQIRAKERSIEEQEKNSSSQSYQLQPKMATAIIAVTASNLDKNRTFILSTACDDFIRKPFPEAEIFNALQRHLGVRFIYDEPTVASLNIQSQTDISICTAIDTLPADLVADFRQALLELDVERVQTSIAQIRLLNEPLADAIATFANKFQYEQLLNCISSS